MDGADSGGDVGLLRRMERGDRAALGSLYDRYAPILCGLGMQMLGSRSDAEAVMQDVFLDVWKDAARYDAMRGSVRAWLVLRMRERCLERRPATSAEPMPSDESWVGPDSVRLRAQMQSLSAEQRSALELSYFKGLSGTEIAARLGITVGAVQARLSTGLERLRVGLGVSTS